MRNISISMITRLSLALLTTFFGQLAATNKPHEIWWENNLESEEEYALFASWLGGIQAPSRVAMRNHIYSKQYDSILDVPCGLCTDYYGFLDESSAIDYTGLDITPQLIQNGQEAGVPCVLGSIENIPFPEKSFDVTYSRHILEHLDKYETALNEIIRVSKKEALVVFFIKPSDNNQDSIRPGMYNDYLLYHNVYSRKKLENFLFQNPRVSSIEWQDVNRKEIILHIYL